MKKQTLSILTIAVIFAPLTALAQKMQRKQSSTTPTDTFILDRTNLQINHNAYGVPLNPQEDIIMPKANASEDNTLSKSEIE